jgi:hypothetical protein
MISATMMLQRLDIGIRPLLSDRFEPDSPLARERQCVDEVPLADLTEVCFVATHSPTWITAGRPLYSTRIRRLTIRPNSFSSSMPALDLGFHESFAPQISQ